MIDKLNTVVLTAALAQLGPLGNSDARGTVALIQRGETVQVIARVTGLTPGLHAFHVHEHGDCTRGAATGNHVAPDGSVRSEHHGGEFGALFADEQGNASLNILLANGSLAIGRSIVVHSSPDDFFGSPAPSDSKTVACGVIRPYNRPSP